MKLKRALQVAGWIYIAAGALVLICAFGFALVMIGVELGREWIAPHWRAALMVFAALLWLVLFKYFEAADIPIFEVQRRSRGEDS